MGSAGTVSYSRRTLNHDVSHLKTAASKEKMKGHLKRGHGLTNGPFTGHLAASEVLS